MKRFIPKTFFFSCFFLSQSLLALVLSTGIGGGVTFYNNDFYLQSIDKENYKDMTNNLFGSNLQLYLGFYLSKKVRLELNQNFRSRANIQTKEYSFLENNKTINFTSSLAGQSTSLNLIYEIAQDSKKMGFIGFGASYYRNNLGRWSIAINNSQASNSSRQTLKEKKFDSWSAKILAGSSYQMTDNYYAELCLAFSFIEFIETGSEKLSDFSSSENVGVWNLAPPYRFPTRPLDIALNMRYKFAV